MKEFNLPKNLYFSSLKRIFFLIVIISSPAYGAECEIDLDDVKPRVKLILGPLDDQFNLLIPKEDFVKADRQIALLIEELKSCEIYHREFEFKEYDYPRWGEKSIPYSQYSVELFLVKMQLSAAVDSFEFGILRVFFKYDLREKVADELYRKEI